MIKLTDEQILAIERNGEFWVDGTPMEFARAIEAEVLRINGITSEEPKKPHSLDELRKQMREVTEAAYKAPGKAVRMPELVATEGRKFMRGEPSLFDQLPFGEVQQIGSVPDASPAPPQAEQAGAAKPEMANEGERADLILLLNSLAADSTTPRAQAMRKAAAILSADSKDAVEPVLYQYRWLNPTGNQVEPKSLLEWKLVEVRNVYTDTIEERVRELEAYRHQDKPVYEVRALYARPQAADAQPLTVRLTSFPESNGNRNWTALLVRKKPWDGLRGNSGGVTLAHGEMWNRVAYEAERARFLIGERATEPYIMDYGVDIKTPDEWAGEQAHGITGKDKAS